MNRGSVLNFNRPSFHYLAEFICEIVSRLKTLSVMMPGLCSLCPVLSCRKEYKSNTTLSNGETKTREWGAVTLIAAPVLILERKTIKNVTKTKINGNSANGVVLTTSFKVTLGIVLAIRLQNTLTSVVLIFLGKLVRLFYIFLPQPFSCLSSTEAHGCGFSRYFNRMSKVFLSRPGFVQT